MTWLPPLHAAEDRLPQGFVPQITQQAIAEREEMERSARCRVGLAPEVRRSLEGESSPITAQIAELAPNLTALLSMAVEIESIVSHLRAFTEALLALTATTGLNAEEAANTKVALMAQAPPDAN